MPDKEKILQRVSRIEKPRSRSVWPVDGFKNTQPTGPGFEKLNQVPTLLSEPLKQTENGGVGAQQGRDHKLGQTHVIRLGIRLNWKINKRAGMDPQTTAESQPTPATC
ncbi:unnamed protein product [Pleuronectes platessa]|uniref:Uncharacterized protein n=1 Tax=Pleuronectes platessa TaxID=8262 RepID=A0A9N7YBZ2_PLEPL|nr:unnamed protein product [Pleuronectes platessa]